MRCVVSASAVTPDALASVILVVGTPRSGTTWLAKIIDSHPDVLYRHEPDETLPGPPSLTGAALPALLSRWAADRHARSVTKQPFFPKSWQPGWARTLRTVFAGAASAASRLPAPLDRCGRLQIPDLMRRPAPRPAGAWAPRSSPALYRPAGQSSSCDIRAARSPR